MIPGGFGTDAWFFFVNSSASKAPTNVTGVYRGPVTVAGSVQRPVTISGSVQRPVTLTGSAGGK